MRLLVMRYPRFVLCCSGWIFVCAMLAVALPGAVPERRPVRIMAVGDSITAGAASFSVYRYPLWEKLFAAGYVVEFVGTQTSETRVGPLAHEGYGGKNVEFLAETVPAHFRSSPADVVLLHSGHNHSVEEAPIPGIVAATERLIDAFQDANPAVIVLVAQVIPAGKLPKYAYIPELNDALAAMVRRRDPTGRRVRLVDQASGFDWPTDTVDDHVHPNAQGAEKMATTWFAALREVLPPPPVAFAPRTVTYRRVDGVSLELSLFLPTTQPEGARRRPAVVFFFGGGWVHGTPIQFYPECAALAAAGCVAVSADYRRGVVGGGPPVAAVDDTQAALRWVRQHAEELGIDPNRIVAAGASAGGHLAMLAAWAEPAARPNALFLLYPILDTGPDGFGHAVWGGAFRDYSPLHRLVNSPCALPPMVIITGADDAAARAATAMAFQRTVLATGGACDLVVIPGGKHPLYAYREGGGPLREAVVARLLRFVEGDFATAH